MALNLQTLTDSSTSAGILTDLAKSASNLELVASLENQVSGGANATQTTASKQPRSHVPLGDGHLYLSGVSDNNASVAFPTIGSSEDFVLEMEVDLADVNQMHLVSGSNTTERIIIYNSGTQFQCNLNGSAIGTLNSPLATGLSVIRCERASNTVTLKQDGVIKGTLTGVNGSANFTQISKGNFATGVSELSGSLKKVTLSVAGTEELNIDFSDGDHKASSFTCSTGQTVTINTSGNDPATIVRRPFLRFDGVNNFLNGSFNESNTTGGYMFVVYSVNGDGGQASARVFVMNSAGESGYSNVRSFLWSLRKSGDNNIAYYHNQSWRGIHTLGFDPVDGTLLHEVKAVDGEQFSKVNNGDLQTTSFNLSYLSSEEFNIGSNPYGTSNYPAIDIEALYLFDETLTDEDATKVRDYLNAKSSIY